MTTMWGEMLFSRWRAGRVEEGARWINALFSGCAALALGACAAPPAPPLPAVSDAAARVDDARAAGAVMAAPAALYAARVALAQARLLEDEGQTEAAVRAATLARRHAEAALRCACVGGAAAAPSSAPAPSLPGP